jgi:pyochelin biosynthetic protein PchC
MTSPAKMASFLRFTSDRNDSMAGVAVQVFGFAPIGETSGFFSPWLRHLRGNVEFMAARYPDSGGGIDKSAYQHIDAMAYEFATEVANQRTADLALFGHGMGGHMAFEVARRLETIYSIKPIRLAVSGCRVPPTLPYTGVVREDEALAKLGHGRLSDTAMTDARADYALFTRRLSSSGCKIDAPIHAFVGSSDPHHTIEQMFGWSSLSRNGFSLRTFPGDNLYLADPDRATTPLICRTMLDDITRNVFTPTRPSGHSSPHRISDSHKRQALNELPAALG